jgi:dihydroneopterin aldolase
MNLMSSFISLRNMRFHAFHGVMPQEQVTGGDFVVSVRAGYDVADAMRTDRVEDTLNYAVLYDLVKREMMKPSQLLEHVAGRIGESIFREMPGVKSLDIELTKQNPPMGADCDGASVELHLER